MKNLESLDLFVRIVERRGMAAAGRELGLSAATVSARLASLEEHFGARLLTRTTRSLSPTSEGLVLLEGARRVLDEVHALESLVRRGADHLSGSIRVSAPIDIGRSWLVPLIDAFVAKHPSLHVELHLSDGYVDLAGGRFDLALRYGALHDSTLVVRKLVQVRRIVCAAPRYLERHAAPVVPKDLEDHNCLLMRFGDEPDSRWPFVVKGKPVRISVRGNRASNDGELVRRWCVRGFGVALKSEADVGRDLRAGRVVRLLREFEAPATDLQLVYAAGRAPARRVRALRDHVIDASATLMPSVATMTK
jgi:DNA-binding transcriptional LysR family regulator